jgi:aspartate dehydrogenase
MRDKMSKPHIGMIGCGAIAQGVVEVLAHEHMPACAQLTFLVRPHYKAATELFLAPFIGRAAEQIHVITHPDDFYRAGCSFVVECAGHNAVREHGVALLQRGVDLILISAGALADENLFAEMMRAAQATQAQISLSSGAMGGLDILSAAARAGLDDVSYTSTKPAHAWRGTPAEDVIDVTALKTATAFYRGNARQAAQIYSKNANVAALIALAGIGFERTRVNLIADPDAQVNSHALSFTGTCCDVTLSIRARPHPLNPKTSQTTFYALAQDILTRHALLRI